MIHARYLKPEWQWLNNLNIRNKSYNRLHGQTNIKIDNMISTYNVHVRIKSHNSKA